MTTPIQEQIEHLSAFNALSDQNARLADENARLKAELKELKALDPQRQRKQIKRLQDEKRQLNDSIQRLKSESIQSKKVQGQARIKQLEEHLQKAIETISDHSQKNQQLQAIIDQLNNDQLDTQRVWKSEDGNWAFIDDAESTDKLYIEHIPTGAIRVFSRDDGVQRAVAIPDAIKSAALNRLQQF